MDMDITFDWRLSIFWILYYGILLTILISVEYNFVHKKTKRKLNEIEKSISKIEKAISEIGKADEEN
jgi:uncharacterized membrane protein YecN with MAPEG domain